MSIKTFKHKTESKPIFTEIAKECAAVWNEVDKYAECYSYAHGLPCRTWIGNPKIFDNWADKKISKEQSLHSQTIQKVRRKYVESFTSFLQLQKNGKEDARPPGPKNYYTPIWLKSAIRFEKGWYGKRLKLSMGRGNNPLYIQLHKSFDYGIIDQICEVSLVYNYGQWVLHFTYRLDSPKYPKVKEHRKVFGVDLGEIHPIVASDENTTHVFNGRYIRSLYRLRNKVIGSFQKLLSKCVRHSRRYKKLIKRKWKYLHYLNRKIKDCVDKQIRSFVNVCLSKDITKVFIGDLSNIRDHINFGKKNNQKLHQWLFGQLTQKLTYKLKEVGIEVELISEAYSSRTCPSCNYHTKPQNRTFKCSTCGFVYHRDGIGAINIRRWGLLPKSKRPRKLQNVSGMEQTASIPVVSPMSATLGHRLKLA